VRKLFLAGATGRLGRKVLEGLGQSWIVHPCSRSGGADLTVMTPGEAVPADARYCLNCAAVSSRGECAGNPAGAFLLNALWPARLAEYCLDSRRRLVHISTDLVYSGGIPPYTESSPACPSSIYGWTKLLGDRAVIRRNPLALVVRTSVLVGEAGAAVPTFTEDILQGRATVFHVDSFRNHTEIGLLAEYLEKALLSEDAGLVLAAAPYSMSRAAYAFSVLKRDVNMAMAPEGIPRDLTLRPKVRLEEAEASFLSQ
jgi:dTDP-4-dehydrorhamnose reductase